MIDRSIPPITSLPTLLTLPDEQAERTTRGVKLHTIRAQGADVVRLTLVFRAGSAVQSKPYLAMTATAMLSEGTSKMTAMEIAEKLDFYGIYYDTTVDRDWTMITVATVGEFLDHTLELLAQILIEPTFPSDQLKIYAAKRREQMIIDNEKPSYIARRAFVEALFGEDHPYGRFSSPEAIEKLMTHDLRDFHEQWLGCENMFAVASGNVSDEVRAKIVEFVDSLPLGTRPVQPDFEKVEIRAEKKYIVRKDAVQSSIRLGRVVPGKGHEDYVALQLLTTVFGGYFSSRLMQNLRENKGYTYGVYASVVSLQHEAYMAVGCEVGAQYRYDAIGEIYLEMRRLQQELIPDEELQMAKNTIVGELMRILDGPFGIADVSIENIQSLAPIDYVNLFLQKINALAAPDLMAVARKYYDPKDLTEVCVGPDLGDALHDMA